MPTLDQASVYLVSQYEARVLPEYAPGKPVDVFQKDVKLYDPDTRTVNVYVPVYRCSQFWIAYHALPQEAETRFFYYKLSINGRPIVSWGCGEKDSWGGKTMFSLYRGWLNGKPDPIAVTEARTFHWGKSRDESEAEPTQDVIEVRMYRAKARKRVDEEVQQFADTPATVLDYHKKKNDNSASVGLFSAGPLMYGQPKRYYKYALVDAVDEPHVTFRFLYRTLPQLKKLGVIALDELEKQRAEEEAAATGSETPTKSKGPRIIPSVSVRSIVSIRSERGNSLPADYTPFNPQVSPSPLRIPTMLSVGRRMGELNVSADDLSQQARDSLSDEEDDGKDQGQASSSESMSSLYLNENSSLSPCTATKAKVMRGQKVHIESSEQSSTAHTGQSLSQLGTIPVLRPQSSKEQSFRDCISSLLGQNQGLNPTAPAPPDASPTPPPRRNRLFSRSSAESFRSSSSPTNAPRSSSSISHTSVASSQSISGNGWINDIFSKARGRAEDRVKKEQEQAIPNKSSVAAPIREGHQESMNAFAGLVNSARERNRSKQQSGERDG